MNKTLCSAAAAAAIILGTAGPAFAHSADLSGSCPTRSYKISADTDYKHPKVESITGPVTGLVVNQTLENVDPAFTATGPFSITVRWGKTAPAYTDYLGGNSDIVADSSFTGGSCVGPQGPAGTNGTNGTQGPKGDKGDAGLTGAQGPSGEDGSDGENGTNGVDGAPGSNGEAGANGSDGADGADGQNGTDGSNGETGPQGPQGVSGEINVTLFCNAPFFFPMWEEMPFDLDQTDCVGPAGPQGPAGENGNNGLNGNNGIDGKDGVAGPAGPAGKDADLAITTELNNRLFLLEHVAPATPISPAIPVAPIGVAELPHTGSGAENLAIFGLGFLVLGLGAKLATTRR